MVSSSTKETLTSTGSARPLRRAARANPPLISSSKEVVSCWGSSLLKRTSIFALLPLYLFFSDLLRILHTGMEHAHDDLRKGVGDPVHVLERKVTFVQLP